MATGAWYTDRMGTRTFFALDLPEDVRDAIVEAQGRLRSAADGKVNWVERENLHVTMKFLGDVHDADLADALRAAASAVASVPRFELDVRGVSTVPPGGRDLRMLWVNVHEPTGRLVELFGALEDALASQGFGREDREFHAHVTLARVKHLRDARPLREAVKDLADADFGSATAAELTAYASRLTPQGPVYTPMGRLPLGT